MTTYNVIVLASVMVAGGALGGSASHLFSRTKTSEDDVEQNGTRPPEENWATNLFVGIVAALLVPLFLKLISSDLIEKVSSVSWNGGVPFEMFVVGGFCVIAGVSSRAFVEMISGRVLDIAKKAREDSKLAVRESLTAVKKAEEAEPIVARFTEPSAPSVSSREVAATGLSDKDKKILNALENEEYAFRTVAGVVGETRLDEAEVEESLERLRERGVVGKKTTETRVLWFLRSEGRELVRDTQKTGRPTGEGPK